MPSRAGLGDGSGGLGVSDNDDTAGVSNGMVCVMGSSSSCDSSLIGGGG